MSWQKRKRKEEKNNINWDYIKHLQFLIDNEKSDDRFKGEKQKHKFLNHENEITRKAAQQMYDRYLGMSDKDRRWGKYK